MKPIVVVGSINMDLVSRVESIPAPGQTVLGHDFQMYSGGKGANQAVAVARLGYPSIMLGMVGNDLFGQKLLKTLQDYGVDTSQIDVVNTSSGTASIAVDKKGENSIIVTPGANGKMDRAYLDEKLPIIRKAGMVLAQLEIPIDAVLYLASLCKELNIPLMLDPAPARSLDKKTLSSTQWFTPNESEAKFYSEGAIDTEVILGKIFAAGAQNIVLKQGDKGALLAKKDGTRIWMESFTTHAVDTTAAGDSFNGAFAVALMSNKGEQESLRFAAAAAALSVSKPGAQSSLPSNEEVGSILCQVAAG